VRSQRHLTCVHVFALTKAQVATLGVDLGVIQASHRCNSSSCLR
jgi:hypothetical protein